MIDTGFTSWEKIKNEIGEQLFNILVEYARTPIKDRKDKEFYLRFKKVISVYSDPSLIARDIEMGPDYFNINLANKSCRCVSPSEGADKRYRYTKEELEEIKKVLHTYLKQFDIIEVKE